jgi:hypothetical protein
MLFKNSVRTSKRTPHFTITKINWLTLFKFNTTLDVTQKHLYFHFSVVDVQHKILASVAFYTLQIVCVLIPGNCYKYMSF